MTKRELANKLYELNVLRGICNPETGCGKEEWVRRTLFGCGACGGSKKEELEQAIKWAEEDLNKKQIKLA